MSSEKAALLPLTSTSPLRPRRAKFRWLIPLISFVLLLGYQASLVILRSGKPYHLDETSDVPNNIQRLWAQYSPWSPAGTYTAPPEECDVVQVNILQRHGARYPNSGDDFDVSVKALASAKKFKDSHFKFLDQYKYDLGKELLVPFGARQTFEAGGDAFERYAHLFDDGSIPFVRASGASRVINSANNWTAGFAAASRQRLNPYLNVVIPENINNTLNNDCPNASNGAAEMNEWLAAFAPPIIRRFERLAPGAKISPSDVFNLMAMCPFHTVATEQLSPFCKLFSRKEFEAFEYHGDVEKYYKTGYGEKHGLGAIQGVGHINELLARLTETPVHDKTTHNSSLPFPLDRRFYVDFTHENVLVAVYSAMGLFNISKPLDTKHMNFNTRWSASRMVPFSARLVVEKLVCNSGKDVDMGQAKKEKKGVKYVRVFVNDALQPLEFCGEGKGMCLLDSFVKSQGYARRSGDGDFERCYN